MYLDVSQALVRPMVDFPFSVTVPLEPQIINGDNVQFDDVRVIGSYTMIDDTVNVQGSLETRAHAPCAVCLAETLTPIYMSFSEAFRTDADEEEDGIFRFEGRQLPLDHMVLTLVLLNLPMRFTCAEPCQPASELKEWNEAETVWAEDSEETDGSYRPFENLKLLLEENEQN